MMKVCKKCGEQKSIKEFYAHAMMADGRLSFCKVCVRARVLVHREKNLERIQAYDRFRGQLPHRIALQKAVSAKYKGRPRPKAHSLARAANIIVGNAVRDGRLVKEPCARCGSTRRIHGHHEDYYKPLQVVWLCAKHHGERHRELNEQKRGRS